MQGFFVFWGYWKLSKRAPQYFGVLMLLKCSKILNFDKRTYICL
jgi:hypothetical protein